MAIKVGQRQRGDIRSNFNIVYKIFHTITTIITITVRSSDQLRVAAIIHHRIFNGTEQTKRDKREFGMQIKLK